MNRASVMAAAVIWAIRHRLLRGALRRLARKVLAASSSDVEIDGVKLRCHLGGNATGFSILMHGAGAPNLGLARTMDGLRPGDVFVDVGANCGVFTAFAAKHVGVTGRVIAIEPIPAMLERLRFNVKANGFTNVTVFETAVGEARGTATLYIRGHDHGQSTLVMNEERSWTQQVPVTPLADVIVASGVRRIDTMKIDIEGFEDRALAPFVKSAPRSLWPRRIFMETRHRKRWEINCVQALLDAGYTEAWSDEYDMLLVLTGEHGATLSRQGVGVGRVESAISTIRDGSTAMVVSFVINLDRSKDRLAAMAEQFSRAGMAFERIPAVDGNKLPESVRPYFCDRTGKIVSSLRPGEMGCYASHIVAWQRMAGGEYGPAVLVCEDDIRLPDDFPDLLAEIIAKAPVAWDLIRLSSISKRAVVQIAKLSGGYRLVRYSRQPTLSGASLISASGARKLLAPMLRHRAVDQDLRRPWQFGVISYGVEPRPVEQLFDQSIIDTSGGRAGRTLEPADTVQRAWYALRTLGLRQWIRCAAWNILGRRVARRASLVAPLGDLRDIERLPSGRRLGD